MGNSFSKTEEISFCLWKCITEKYIHTHLSIPSGNNRHQQSYLIPPSLLQQLLMTNEDLIQNNKDDIIEYLIGFSEDSKKMKKYQKWIQIVQKCHYLAQLRINSFSLGSFKELIPKNIFEQINPNFSCEICTILYQNLINPGSVDNEIQQYINILKPLPQFSVFSHPSNETLINLSAFSGIVTLNSINLRGMCTNGYYLFLLSSENMVSAYPILENGSLLSPITNKLNIPDDSNASITASINSLIVTSFKQQYFYDLNKIVHSFDGTIDYIANRSHKFDNIIISDGIVDVIIDHEFNVLILSTSNHKNNTQNNNDNYKKVHRVKLCQGDAQVNDFARNVLSESLFTCPAETNGVFLSFYLRVDNLHMLCRQFSLITGKHVADKTFEFPYNIISMSYDGINKQHLIALNENGRFVIHSYSSSSCINPYLFGFQNVFENIIVDENNNSSFFQLLCLISQYSFSSITENNFSLFLFPNSASIITYISMVTSLLSIYDDFDESSFSFYYNAIQILVIMITENVRYFLSKNDILKERILMNITELLYKLSNMKNPIFEFVLIPFIFTMILNYLTFNDQILCLLDKILHNPNTVLVLYIIRQASNCQSFVSIHNVERNYLFDKYIKSLPDSINPLILAFLISMQKSFIKEVLVSLQKDEFSSITLFSKDTKKDQSLEAFANYLTFLIDKFLPLIMLNLEYNELREAPVFILFDNFLMLIAGLSNFHGIAQIVNPLLHIVPSAIKDKFNTRGSSIIATKIGIVSGAFSSTLLKGGDFSSFEDKYKWLIWPNIYLVEKSNIQEYLLSDNIEMYSLETQKFLNNSDTIMNYIYGKWKPAINRNIKEPFLTIDKFFLATLLKHTNKYHLIENYNTSIPEMRSLLEQMARVRNTARQFLQEGKSIDDMILKCKILLKMKSNVIDDNKTAKLISDFMVSKDTSYSIINFIANQKNRLVLTNIGFNIVESKYNNQENPYFIESFSVLLSTIDNFDGLSTILRYDTDKKSTNSIFAFLKKVVKSDSKFLLLIAHKLLKGGAIPDELIGDIVQNLLPKAQYDPKMFALVFERVGYVTKYLAQQFDFENMTDKDWFFLSDAFRRIKCPHDLYLKIVSYFYNCPINKLHMISLCIYRAIINLNLDQHSEKEIIKKNFLFLLKSLGDFIIDSNNIERSSYIICILRKILCISNDVSFYLCEIINSIKPETATDSDICAVFSILGGFLDIVKPYSQIIFSKISEGKESNKINNETLDDSHFISNEIKFLHGILLDNNCAIEFPIGCESKVFEINSENVFLDSQGLNNQFNPLTFPNYEYVCDFFDRATASFNSRMGLTYLNSLSNYLREPSFIENISPSFIEKIMKKLQFTISPLGSFEDNKQLLFNLMCKPEFPTQNEFSKMISLESPVISFISPVLSNKSPIEINFACDHDFEGYLGLVSETCSKYNNYFVVNIPTMMIYPNVKRIEGLKIKDNNITFTIDPVKREIILGKHKINFLNLGVDIPIRAFIGVLPPVNVIDIVVKNQQNVLIPNFEPCISPWPPLLKNQQVLLKYPEWVNKNLKDSKSLLNVIDQLPKFDSIELNNPCNRNYFFARPMSMPINSFEAHQMSLPMKQFGLKILFGQLSSQISMIIIMRLINHGFVNFIKSPIRIHSLLLCALETFDIECFENNTFPFYLENSLYNDCANSSTIDTNLRNECFSCLEIVKTHHSFKKEIENYIEWMMNQPNTHCSGICYDQNPLEIIKPPIVDAILISSSNLKNLNDNYIRVNNHPKSLPYNITEERSMIKCKKHDRISCLNISFSNNDWILGTDFELLILLKQYMNYFPHQRPSFIRRIYMELILIQSPFVYCYIPEILLNFTQEFLSPLEVETKYVNCLLLLGGFIKKYNVSQQISTFFYHEKRNLLSTTSTLLAPYFPEFNINYGKPFQNNESTFQKNISISIPSLDIKTPIDDVISLVFLYRSFMIERDDIIGFPFWEVLPIWIAFNISGFIPDSEEEKPKVIKKVNFADNNKEKGEINNVIIIDNPSELPLIVTISLDCKISPDSLLLISTTPDFSNPTIIDSQHISNSFQTKSKILYISQIDIPKELEQRNIDIRVMKKTIDPESKNFMFNPFDLHDAFLEEITIFIKKWKSNHTEELLSIIPHYMFNQPQFEVLKECVLSSQLRNIFPTRIVLLVTFVLFRINYFYKHFQDQIPGSFWSSVRNLISSEEAAGEFVQAISISYLPPPSLYFNRHEARRIIVDGYGNQSNTIIAQFSRQIYYKFAMNLRCKNRPWTVKFYGESAIDAGGPAFELFSEISSSIFEPTSKLFIPVPNSIYKCGTFRDTFVPFTNLGFIACRQYYSIGVFIGIVIRTGISQALPFAPLIWKFLAKEKITENDVFLVDDKLKIFVERIRKAKNDPNFEEKFKLTWTVEDWDGSLVKVSRFENIQFVKGSQVEMYISECIKKRIESLYPHLERIRNGFYDNIGFQNHRFMTSNILSLLAQGSNIITTDQLRNITFFDYSIPVNTPGYENFWIAIEMMTNNQRSLFLKFVTTLTRLPNPAINPDFKISVTLKRDSTDMMLPSASTCFNKLYLPAYSTSQIAYKKITLAIENCQTMENS
ncbi:hypothetical protein TRFO_27320 [Tritrichomonas foetus]|uniref:HECT domain-containing protein n=1 Tax=Tritrichomonas foetus TaxID=1144522 RepID=A0A1J4K6B3_9EUKA|nr:hypothetical protein TRFO_27320 [Tritrichomonas foetus]|eukprot:OHT05013.1 hypothetical protein TRFO_27320 [Tritrichomonas foetus]